MTFIALILIVAPLPAQSSIGPRPDYSGVAAALQQVIASEMDSKGIPAMSIALVDDQEIVWAQGFGVARADSTPATAETVYRAGSVSKILTDLAVMRLVEAGKVALDTPITRYLPEFTPPNPSGTPLTLRLLMSHYAGLVREPAVGNYFDTSGASLAATVASLNGTPLIYAPGTRYKYSNAGLAVVGAVIERVTGEPFAGHVQRAVLDPLGAAHSAFTRTPDVAARLADAQMWTLDGRRSRAPAFEFGMSSSIGLYATVTDLARLWTALFAAATRDSGAPGGGGGVAVSGLLRPESIGLMWTPQFAAPTARAGMGLGFFLSQLDGRRRVSHDGAVYGFGTQLAALPDDRLGVVVTSTLDGSSGAGDRVATYALRLMLAAREGRALPGYPATQPLAPGTAARVAGRYVGGPRDVELRRRGNALFYVPAPGRAPVAVRARGDTLVVDDARESGLRMIPLENALLAFNDTLRRVPDAQPDTAPRRFVQWLGEYGWDHNTMFVYEDHGRLFALIQWFFAYPLAEVNDSVFAFPQLGLYPGERVIFHRGPNGRAVSAEAGNVVFPRRQVGPDEGGQLRLRPTSPVPQLLRAARRATPPVDTAARRAPDLVDLAKLEATLRFDIRYATTNNFLGSRFYSRPRAFLQRPAAEALVRAHRALKQLGLGLLIHDAYRPWYVTKTFWDATPQESRWLVADPTRGSRHNRGCAVDLTLYELATGRVVAMVGTYDEATPRSLPDYTGGTTLQRWHRRVLREAMEAQGFIINSEEWWHFDYPEWQAYPIINKSFEDLK
jgi:CubicO group peptidase (beta-lactamase class C family)/D-alanyl-D-alanine dipeptidase